METEKSFLIKELVKFKDHANYAINKNDEAIEDLARESIGRIQKILNNYPDMQLREQIERIATAIDEWKLVLKNNNNDFDKKNDAIEDETADILCKLFKLK